MRKIILLTIAVSLLAFTLAAAPPSLRVSGLWRSGDGSKQVLVGPSTASQLIQKRNELANQGLAIHAIAVFHANDADQYVAVFEPTPNAKSVSNLLSGTWDQFRTMDGDLFAKGYRVVDVALSMDPHDARKVRYTAVWRTGLGSGAQWTDFARNWNDFSALATQRFSNGLRIVAMSSVAVMKDVQAGTMTPLFTATWHGGIGTGAMYIANPAGAASYMHTIDTWFTQNLRLVANNVYTLNGSTPIYTGVVRNDAGGGAVWASAASTWDAFVAEHNKRVKQGMKLVDIALYTTFVKID